MAQQRLRELARLGEAWAATGLDATLGESSGEYVTSVPTGLTTCRPDFDASPITGMITSRMLDGCEAAEQDAVAVESLKDLNRHFTDDKLTSPDFRLAGFGDEPPEQDVGEEEVEDVAMKQLAEPVVVAMDQTVGVFRPSGDWRVDRDSENEGALEDDGARTEEDVAASVPPPAVAVTQEVLTPHHAGSVSVVDVASDDDIQPRGARPDVVSLADGEDAPLSSTAAQAELENALEVTSRSSSPRAMPNRAFVVPDDVPPSNEFVPGDLVWMDRPVQDGPPVKRKTVVGTVPMSGPWLELFSTRVWHSELAEATQNPDQLLLKYTDGTKLRVAYRDVTALRAGSRQLLVCKFSICEKEQQLACLLDLKGSMYVMVDKHVNLLSKTVSVVERSHASRDFHAKCAVCGTLASPAFPDSDGWQACHFECRACLGLLRECGVRDCGLKALEEGDSEMQDSGDVVEAYLSASSCLSTAEHPKGFLVDLRRFGTMSLETIVALSARVTSAVLIHLGPDVAEQDDWRLLAKQAILGGPTCRALVKRTIGCPSECAVIQTWPFDEHYSAEQLRCALMRSSRRDGTARRSTAMRKRLKAEANPVDSDASSESVSVPVTQSSEERIQELTNMMALLVSKVDSMYNQHNALQETTRRRAAFMNREMSMAFCRTWGHSMSDTTKNSEMRMLFSQCAKEEDARARVLTGLGLFGRASDWRPNDDHIIEDEVVRNWQTLQVAWPSTFDVAAHYLPTGPAPPCNPMPELPPAVVVGGKAVSYDADAMGSLVSHQDLIDYAEECRRRTARPVPPVPVAPSQIPVAPADGRLFTPSPPPYAPPPPGPASSSGSALQSTEGLFQGKSISLPFHTLEIFDERKADLARFRESWFCHGLRCDEYIFELQSRDEDTAIEAMEILLKRFVVR